MSTTVIEKHSKKYNCDECENEALDFLMEQINGNREQAKKALREFCYLCGQCNNLDPFYP